MADQKTDLLDPSSDPALSLLPSKESDWKFTQWFRKMQNDPTRVEEGEDSDYLSAVEFDETGKYLATGDRSGHIVILENDTQKARETSSNKAEVHYTFYAEFTSHNPDFDFVRSLNIEEKINQIKWGAGTNNSLYLLTTNDKVIKLWKVSEKEMYKYVNWNIETPPPMNQGPQTQLDPTLSVSNLDMTRAQPSITHLKVPKIIKGESARMPALKKTFASDVHQYNITSLSVSADKESFISGDNLRINLWNFGVSDRSYNVLDIKPDDMQELNEIISSIDYHPSSSNLFIYSSSLGNIRLCDLRQRALVDEPHKVFSQKKKLDLASPAEQLHNDDAAAAGDQKSFFDEMTQNVTAAKFSRGGRFIISRDYMSVKIWDVNQEKKPLETIYVHEFLRDKMWELYSSDLLWDGFGLGISSRGDVVTGSYSNFFHLFNLGEKTDTFVQASKPPMAVTPLSRFNTPKQTTYQNDGNMAMMPGGMGKKKKTNFGFTHLFTKKKKNNTATSKSLASKDDGEFPYNIDFATIEFNKKILECAWHPETNAVAVAGQNNLYIYAQ